MTEKPKQKNFLSFLKSRNFWILIFSTAFFVTSVLIAWPYFYEIKYQINPPADNIVQYKVSNPELLLPAELKSPDADPEKIKQELAKLEFKDRLATNNRLVIPKIAVDTPIVEGSDLDILLKEEGAWREPNSANPSQSGNMVIAGHRFQYLPPNTTTFYNLNKLKTGDKILVYWKEGDVFKDYIYEIYETLTVNPQDTFVRNFNPNNNKEITLYTCGPEVGDNSKRIVVKGKIIS